MLWVKVVLQPEVRLCSGIVLTGWKYRALHVTDRVRRLPDSSCYVSRSSACFYAVHRMNYRLGRKSRDSFCAVLIDEHTLRHLRYSELSTRDVALNHQRVGFE